MVKTLGIDYGLRRVGIAISDERGVIALPLKTIENSGKKLSEDIYNLAMANKASNIVIGFPLHLDGNKSPLCKNVEEFVAGWEYDIPISLWDERLTTAEATKFLSKNKVNRKKRAKVVDTMAASLILQGYLDCNSQKSS